MGEQEQRLAELRAELGRRCMYVSSRANIRYLTGFTGSAGHLLVTPDSATLFTDGRYRSQARRQTSGLEVVISDGDPQIALARGIARQRLRRVEFEPYSLPYAVYRYLRTELADCHLDPAGPLVEDLRMVKSPGEIEAIKASVTLNSQVFDEVLERSSPDWSEARLAAELEFGMRRLGAEGAAFPTIVASGSHGALPHAEPRSRPVQRGALTVVDQGAILAGYCSDMTRMVAWGEPDATQLALFRGVMEAQAAAVDAVRPGVECRSVHRRARQVLSKFTVAGVRLDNAFRHSTGHGLGLEIHEQPRVAARQETLLREGMVITVEPGAYLDGCAGARVEDVVVVTRQGCEVLTPTSRDLRVLAA